jgi:hypothetical protein
MAFNIREQNFETEGRGTRNSRPAEPILSFDSCVQPQFT